MTSEMRDLLSERTQKKFYKSPGEFEGRDEVRKARWRKSWKETWNGFLIFLTSTQTLVFVYTRSLISSFFLSIFFKIVYIQPYGHEMAFIMHCIVYSCVINSYFSSFFQFFNVLTNKWDEKSKYFQKTRELMG